MITDLKTLINLCEQELSNREYTYNRHRILSMEWENLLLWMKKREYKNFDEDIGYQYCDETFGSHDLSSIQKNNQIRLRAIRMLISYQKEGDFEFRTPSLIRTFSGKSGDYMEAYLKYIRETLNLTESTISNKKQYLYAFNSYLEKLHMELNDLSMDSIEDFYSYQGYSLPSRHNCNSTLRLFFRYAFDVGNTEKDYSIYILPDNYKKHCKIPTTYEEEEIRRILKSVERVSATGKRDYLILLLASEYGWRSSDIVNFRFDQIDWDKNSISFNQQKTGIPVVYPLLSSVGNAIIDYLKNGRPVTNSPELIVSCESAKRGKKLNKTTIHSIVTKYMRIANISHWEEKKHGSHSLRHSLATNLLKKNVSIPIISTVLGHQSTDSTKVYLSVDINSLKQCSLPIPELKTDFYEV